MGFLSSDRETLERYLPGLDKAFSESPLLDLEKPDSIGIPLFREAGGPGLLIPKEYGGLGANPLEAVQIQRALATRSPSLAIATTMHHFSVATLVEICSGLEGLEWLLLEGIARQQLLVASGFAEGQSGLSILTPTMQATEVDGGLLVNGTKKPCSLTWSMDLLTASATLVKESGPESASQLVIVLIPAQSEGIERHRFWGNWVLAGAESDQVILRDVMVPERLVFRAGDASGLDPIQVSGFLWFELLIASSYLGMASALVERAINAKRGDPSDRALLGIEVEGAMAALEGMARSMMEGRRDQDELARALLVRFAVQRAVERAAMHAAEVLGGMAFIQSSEISYLYSAARALAYHPPSRVSASKALVDYLEGSSRPLKI